MYLFCFVSGCKCIYEIFVKIQKKSPIHEIVLGVHEMALFIHEMKMRELQKTSKSRLATEDLHPPAPFKGGRKA